MAESFDSMIRIPILRADLYGHEDSAWTSGGTSGIDPFAVDHLGVDTNVQTAGRVTLSASGAHPEYDGYGVDFDLEPNSARLLARRLLAAVDACDGA